MCALVLVVASPARAEPVAPETAQAIGLGVTAAGLVAGAYLWSSADRLPADDGRDERKLAAAAAATLTLGVGPMTGLLAGGARRRALVGGVARPAMIVVGGLGVVTGALVIGFGCNETDACAGARATGGVMIGAGALLGVAAVAWTAWDLWETPGLVRRRRAGRVQVAPIVGRDRVGLALTLAR